MTADQTESSAQPDHEVPAYSSVRRRWRGLGRLGRGRRLGPLGRGRRLGPLEYALLALVAVGIVITIAMAIFAPSA
jgi:hypothetical protein